jgi:hypothetical protein
VTARPWRAVAYFTLGPGLRHFLGNASAKTRPGLDRCVTRWEALGATVQVWEVLPEPTITAAAEASAPAPALR